jgi:hypothetical protein
MGYLNMERLETLRNRIPEDIVELIISYCFDRRNYHFLHYYNFKKSNKVCLELKNYTQNNYFWEKQNEIIRNPMFLKMIDLKKLKWIKRRWKTLKDLKKNGTYYEFWKQYYY